MHNERPLTVAINYATLQVLLVATTEFLLSNLDFTVEQVNF